MLIFTITVSAVQTLPPDISRIARNCRSARSEASSVSNFEPAPQKISFQLALRRRFGLRKKSEHAPALLPDRNERRLGLRAVPAGSAAETFYSRPLAGPLNGPR